jgi:molecular chaperone DnaJ
MQIRYVGRGEAGDPGAPPGNLLVTLHAQAHELFKRDGVDTYCSIPVAYPVMALGGEINVPTVFGEDTINVPPGTESGKVFQLRGQGLEPIRSRGRRGDHHVQLVVEVPKSLSQDEEDLLRRLAEISKDRVQERGFWQKLFGS